MMKHILTAIENREKGSIPVSIGTALAVESACGIYPDKPVSPAPVTTVKEVWFNLRTLVRNLVGALPGEMKEEVTPAHLIPFVLEELGIIESALVKSTNGLTRTIYYYSDFSSLSRKFPKASLRIPKTPKQVVHQNILDATAVAVMENNVSAEIRKFHFELMGRFPNCFIVTHLPVDLLSRNNFQKLELLESHTGAIKPYPQWHSKLTNGKELSHIPFNAFTLQVFGDNGQQFSPILADLRAEVLKIAVLDRWTSLTTIEKIRFSLRKITDPTNRSLLMAML